MTSPATALAALRRPLLRAAAALALLSALAPAARAITITPSAVYIDSRSRAGTVMLYNEARDPVEVVIGFSFGYPRSDANGDVRVDLLDTIPAGEPSAVAWLRAFPRRVVIQPGQRQIIRITVDAPPTLADGEYWGRLLVTVRGSDQMVEKRPQGVNVAVTLQTMFVQAVNYRKGAVRSSVEVRDSSTTVHDKELDLRLDLARLGNAAFLGHVKTELLDASGRTLSTGEANVAVYHELRVRVPMPIPDSGIPAGAVVRYVIDTDRPDLPPEGPLPFVARRGVVPVPLTAGAAH